jgi:hypothetical protein
MPVCQVWITHPDKSVLVSECNYRKAMSLMGQCLRLEPYPIRQVTVLVFLDGRYRCVQSRCC